MIIIRLRYPVMSIFNFKIYNRYVHSWELDAALDVLTMCSCHLPENDSTRKEVKLSTYSSLILYCYINIATMLWFLDILKWFMYLYKVRTWCRLLGAHGYIFAIKCKRNGINTISLTFNTFGNILVKNCNEFDITHVQGSHAKDHFLL